MNYCLVIIRYNTGKSVWAKMNFLLALDSKKCKKINEDYRYVQFNTKIKLLQIICVLDGRGNTQSV